MFSSKPKSMGKHDGSQLKPIFPDVINGKIHTKEFLEASQAVVKMIEKFGKIFAPVKYDMQGNVDKLMKKYVADREGNSTLQDMVLLEIAVGESIVAMDALLWLRRGLYMIQLFFEKIVHDHKTGKGTEDLMMCLKKSYKEALEPFHGWMAQQLFGLLSRMVPNRSQFLQILVQNSGDDEETIVERLDSFTQKLKINMTNLDEFYEDHC